MMRQYVVCKSRFPEAPDMLSDQNLFSFKCKSILPDPLRRDPFRFQIRGIMHPVDLFQSLRCGILQSLLLFCAADFEFDNCRVIRRVEGLQHHMELCFLYSEGETPFCLWKILLKYSGFS